MIRKATVQDINVIYGILKEYADLGKLLHRALSDLYDCTRDFSVYEEEKRGDLVGVCALHIYWEDLAEIRSLAVRRSHQGGGIGSTLVSKALEEARDLGIRRVFALTYEPGFFNKQGFEIIDKTSLPQKIWADCIKCVKFPDCDEIAVLRNLHD